jgi:hypothetical protein
MDRFRIKPGLLPEKFYLDVSFTSEYNPQHGICSNASNDSKTFISDTYLDLFTHSVEQHCDNHLNPSLGTRGPYISMTTERMNAETDVLSHMKTTANSPKSHYIVEIDGTSLTEKHVFYVPDVTKAAKSKGWDYLCLHSIPPEAVSFVDNVSDWQHDGKVDRSKEHRVYNRSAQG